MKKFLAPFLLLSLVAADDPNKPLKDRLQEERIQTELEKLRMEKAKVELELREKQMEYQLKVLKGKILYWEMQRAIDKIRSSNTERSPYTYEPVIEGKIRISDRIIDMPIMITSKGANDIIKKIDFYNRQSNYPIFLVIDVCYGGSVLGGEKIIRAIGGSNAKVYIVVKTFAASMAAIITSTYAENSYVLKNALILHHELSMGAEGNTSKHKASLAGMIRWQEVLFAPIAKRKGISVDQFVDGLYKIKRDGDAVLFASDASLNFSSASLLSGLRSGWNFIALRL